VAALGKQSLGKIKTFSIGLEGSPDILAARKMADFLESDHTEVVFTVEEGLKALREVIWHLESHDTTTVRASVPMYLLSKYIKEHTDVRVILSGEGSDELFGGYMYFHGAPDVEAFRVETGRLVRDVHMFDVLRADRTTAAHGLELRVPFFDRDVVDYVMDGFSTELKMPREGYEKFLLRKAFEDLLPREIAWRGKNGMSDAVGTGWAEALRKHGEHKYQELYKSFFPTEFVPYKWMPRWTNVDDPSGALLPGFRLT
jgi:asparagine synthase (glutamine-hydrolysing)